MADLDKVIRGWERCQECRKLPPGLSQAYVDCEYTIGLYCAQFKLIHETLEVLKEQKAIVMCKDCKHGSHMETSDGMFEVYCSNEMIAPGFVKPDWYCADGERKAGEKDGTDDTRVTPEELCDAMCDNIVPEFPPTWWIFTFGAGQPHAGHYVRIFGTYDSAREKMFQKYGRAWGFQYSEAEWNNWLAEKPNCFPAEELLEVIGKEE